MSLNFSCICCL